MSSDLTESLSEKGKKVIKDETLLRNNQAVSAKTPHQQLSEHAHAEGARNS